MRKKNLKRLIKFILCINLLFGIVPHVVVAQREEEESEALTQDVSETFYPEESEVSS